MKKNIFNKIIVSIVLLSILILIPGCRDSSIDDEFDEASILAAATSTATSSIVSENEASGKLSITDTASQSALSEITLSKDLSGLISIDGSALMSAISDKIAEQFRKACPKISIKTGLSGTEEGINLFIAQKLDICNTSRPFSSSETSNAKSKGADYVEFKVAYDGVVVVVNKSNPVASISLNEIKSIWNPDSVLMNWNEVNAKWPDNNLMVFGPKADTGIIEFFTKNILHTTDNQIGIYTEVNSDKELVNSISDDNTAIGLTSFANYFNAQSSIKALKIDFGSGPVLPDIDSIKNGKYQQLSSPMYLYVSKASLHKTEVKAFIKYYLENASKTVTDAGYVPLTNQDYTSQLSSLN